MCNVDYLSQMYANYDEKVHRLTNLTCMTYLCMIMNVTCMCDVDYVFRMYANMMIMM